MRVLMAISTLSAGGAERIASELVNRWAARGWAVGLLTLAAAETDHYPIDERVERIALDLIWDSKGTYQSIVSNLHRSRMIRRAIKKFAPDVVVSFIEQTNIRVLLALIGTDIPVIVSERIDPRMYPVGRAWEQARRLLYPLAAALVVQTSAVAVWAEKLVPGHKVRIIPNFIGQLPAPSLFCGRNPVIVAVGRLVLQKGFDVLIRSFASSQARSRDWKLLILGEGVERSRLEALIVEKGLQRQVELLGVVKEPWRWLDQAQLFVLPSRFEGFPNALLEAMAMGCACVATDCPSGPREIIQHDQNGLLVPVDDSDTLTAVLDDLIAHPGQRERLALEAQKVRERFGADQVLSRWDESIHAVVNNGE